jgi:hypothetical protein
VSILGHIKALFGSQFELITRAAVWAENTKMLKFQLEVAIALTVGAAASLVVFYFTRPKEGKIKLPTHTDDQEHEHDPFDVTTPEDVVEGYPLQEEAFWAQVRYERSIREKEQGSHSSTLASRYDCENWSCHPFSPLS